jgi:hypothetical protein
MAATDRNSNVRLWFSRLLIAIVVVWNLQCALVFFLHPETFAPGFELTGVPGAAAIRGTAILFVMWNVPYLVALWHPRRYRVSLLESLVMQFVGLVGESAIWFMLPVGHAVLGMSILHFIVFDTAGLVLLAVAVWLAHIKKELPR